MCFAFVPSSAGITRPVLIDIVYTRSTTLITTYFTLAVNRRLMLGYPLMQMLW